MNQIELRINQLNALARGLHAEGMILYRSQKYAESTALFEQACRFFDEAEALARSIA